MGSEDERQRQNLLVEVINWVNTRGCNPVPHQDLDLELAVQ